MIFLLMSVPSDSRVQDLLSDIEQYGVDIESHTVQRDPQKVYIEGTVPPEVATDFGEIIDGVQDITDDYGVLNDVHLDNEPSPDANLEFDCYITGEELQS